MPTLLRGGPHLRSNPLVLSSLLYAKRLIEGYYTSLAWLFKLVRRTQNSRYGTKLRRYHVSRSYSTQCYNTPEFSLAQLGSMDWVSHPPTLNGYDVLVELSNQLTYTG